MTDNTATILSKGCNSTGITEDLAKKLHDNLGKKIVCVVELIAEERGEKRNGKEKVALSILAVEPAPNKDTEDHLRELARAFHYERGLADGQLRIDTADDLEPKVADVLAAKAAHLPHAYTDHEGVCDLCGNDALAPLHQMLEADDEDPEEPKEPAEGDEPEAAQADVDEDPDAQVAVPLSGDEYDAAATDKPTVLFSVGKTS